ncbi:MAG: NUDIX hydrolase [Peptococcaceae bacterium]|jgi:8-oxo-dGTP diphosphatase|nr:NUDIX hydrolase [Peptococcaceae bacterium]
MSYVREFKFCPQCSAKLTNTQVEGKVRKACPACHYIHWGEYSVGVGGVLLQGDRGLLVQRAHNPGKGRWTIPGGYVEQDEKIEDAIVREFLEETGLQTDPVSVLAVKDRPVDVPGVKHDIYIVFLLNYLKGELTPDPREVSQAGFYTPEECQGLNVAPLSLHLMTKALELKRTGKVKPGFVRLDGIKILGALSELYTLP